MADITLLGADLLDWDAAAGVSAVSSVSAQTEQLRFAIVSDPAMLRAMRPEWGALFARAPSAYATQSADWCLAAWDKIAAPRGRALFCLVGYDGPRLVLVWPLVRYRNRFWRILRPLGSETTEYAAVLVEDGRDAEARVMQAWRFLERYGGADVMILPPVPEDTPLERAVRASRRPRTAHAACMMQLRWRDIGDWDALQARLGGDERRNLRRRRRQLAERGRLEFTVIEDIAERRALVEWLLRQKHDWAVKTGTIGHWLRQPEYRDLYLAVAADAALAARHGLVALKLDGRIVAGALCRLDRRRAEGCLLAFDPEFTRYSPGQLLAEDCLRWAHGLGLDFDFRLGNERYKQLWATRSGTATDYCIANSVAGRGFLAWSEARLWTLTLRKKVRGLLARRRPRDPLEPSRRPGLA